MQNLKHFAMSTVSRGIFSSKDSTIEWGGGKKEQGDPRDGESNVTQQKHSTKVLG